MKTGFFSKPTIKLGLYFVLICLFSLSSFGLRGVEARGEGTEGTSGTLEGYLLAVVEDDFEGHATTTRYFLQTDDASVIELGFKDMELTASPGDRVRVMTSGPSEAGIYAVTGIEVVSSAAGESPAGLINGVNRVAVILANFKNLAISTPTKAETITELATRFTPVMAEMSFGKAAFPVDVYGWVVMNLNSTCEITDYAPAAIDAADALINFNNYKYVAIVFPNPGCSYGGLGYYPPGVNYSTNEGTKRLMVTAYPYFDNNFTFGYVFGHELGHNFGLPHANGWECGDRTIGAGCTSYEYGDPFDFMGSGNAAHYGAYYKEYLQWIPANRVQVVTRSGRYEIQPVEQNINGIQSIKIPMEGTSTYYNIENRTSFGADAVLPPNATSGALLKIIANSLGGYTSHETNILDSAPAADGADFLDAGWAPGQTFTDAGRGLRITPVSKTAGVLTVDVVFYGPAPVSPANGATSVPLMPTLDWSDLPYRTNYTLQVSKDSGFTQMVINTSTVNSTYKLTAPLADGTLHYWRVRANYSFGFSDWSTVRSFTTVPLSVSGNTGIGGVTLSYMEGGSPKTASTDAAGNYSITLPRGWSGTITPSRTGFTFNPAVRTITNLTINRTGQNFTPAWAGGVTVTSDRNVVAVARPHVGEEVASYAGFPSGSLTAYLPMLFNGSFGGSYNSAFYLQNVHASSSAHVTIKYYDSAGTLNCTKADTIAPRASVGYWVPSTACDSGSLPPGWVGGVVVTSDQPLTAVGRPHVGDEIMTYDGFTGGSTWASLPMLFKGAFGGTYDSAFYIQNTHAASTANVTIKYYDDAGNLNCTATDSISPLASRGYWVPGVACDSGSLPAGWAGGVVVTSDQPIVAIGRPHINGQVTSYNGSAAGNTTAYIPMLFKNAYGGSYNSAVYVQNAAAITSQVTLQFIDSDGALDCTKTDSLAPLASKGYWLPAITCDTGSLPAGWVGGVVIVTGQPSAKVARAHIGAQVTTYTGFTGGGNTFHLPMLFRAAFGGSYNSAFYVQNTETLSAAVTINYYDSSGVLSCTRTDTIPPKATVGYWVPGEACPP